jgi:phage gpG-like protein
MSTKNQISIVIPQTIIDEVTNKLQECRTTLAPYLQGLKADERITMLKLGDKTVATVQKTKSYMETNPEFIPIYLDKPEFLKDEAVATQLSPIENLAVQLSTDISDTVMLAGSEALYGALLYYGQVKEAHHKGIPTAKVSARASASFLKPFLFILL